jgi:hypothetical protein
MSNFLFCHKMQHDCTQKKIRNPHRTKLAWEGKEKRGKHIKSPILNCAELFLIAVYSGKRWLQLGTPATRLWRCGRGWWSSAFDLLQEVHENDCPFVLETVQIEISPVLAQDLLDFGQMPGVLEDKQWWYIFRGKVECKCSKQWT